MASITSNRKFLDRKLPERSYLDFEYEGKPYPSYIRLPFFENIKVSETRNSNLVTHAPIGRNSPLFSWIGAGARNISLEFKMTLPLLIDSVLSISEYKEVSNPDGAQVGGYGKVNAYFAQVSEDNSKTPDIAILAANEYVKSIKEDGIGSFLRENQQLNGNERQELTEYRDLNEDSALNIFNKIDSIISNSIDLVSEGIGSLASLFGGASPASLRQNEVIAIVMFWLNVVRTSVLNNSLNPKYGPPLIRLNHGILYRDVGCVCQSYSIKFDEKAGFDLRTLLPRSIIVNMKLMEVRVGDFSIFEPGHAVKKYNNVGWEVLIDNDVLQTIDPLKDDDN
jgi:hypothetical protein